MIVFYVNFDDWRLATTAFVALSLYGYVTVRVTLWRKKFRQATNKHDNDYHDKATDRWFKIILGGFVNDLGDLVGTARQPTGRLGNFGL